jgi:hypothetical protein
VSRQKKRGGNLENCSLEVEVYIKNIVEKYGSFEFAPARTPLDPDREEDQIKILYPSVSSIISWRIFGDECILV